MSKQLPPFVCTHDGEVTVFSITGELDHPTITLMLERLQSSPRVVFDMSKATGAYSTLMSACIQLATRTGTPVRIRGATRRFEMTLKQMNLHHLIIIEGDAASTEQSSSGANRTAPRRV